MNSIETMKEVPASLEFISNIKPQKTLEAMTEWPTIFKGWEKPDKEEPADSDDWFFWIWSGVLIDLETAFLRIGTNAERTINRLAKAYIIYPDGTFNNNIYQQLQSEAIKCLIRK